MVPVIPALLLLTTGQTPSSDLVRLAYKSGYSVVMPRPFVKRDQKTGPAFVAVQGDRIYIVSAADLSDYDRKDLEAAKNKGAESVEKFLGDFQIGFALSSKILRREAGAFHGMPCVRTVFDAKSGERGALLAIFNGSRVYVLVCVNPQGDTGFTAAQRFFDSFKVEKDVATDPVLGDPPEENPPSGDETTGVA